jgi:hypothetical protein
MHAKGGAGLRCRQETFAGAACLLTGRAALWYSGSPPDVGPTTPPSLVSIRVHSRLIFFGQRVVVSVAGKAQIEGQKG